MFKALIKKEFSAVSAFFLQGKDGKRRSKSVAIVFAILIVYGFGAVGGLFWMMSKSLCLPMVNAELGWVYFAFMSVLATAFGVIGGIFMAKSKLYEAKDNDLLLSMPIPPSMILFVRILELYLFVFLFEALVLVPALIQYFTCVGAQALSVVFGIFLIVVLPLGAVSICCLLGFLLAVVTARIPYKNFFTIAISLFFMVGYFLVYSKMNEYFAYILANSESVGVVMQTTLYPFSQVGKAFLGETGAFFLSILMFGGLFALILWVLSHNYLRVAIVKKGEHYGKYKEGHVRMRNPEAALFGRELNRLLKTPAYLLNASMGTLIMLLIGIMAAIQKDFFGIPQEILTAMGDTLILLVCGIVCFMASSNTIAACAVSLEGESIWIVQSLPVSSWAILKAKAYLHFFMTAIPSVVFGIAIVFVTKAPLISCLGVALTALVSSATFSVIDLAINLKFPNLHWTNETVAVKQGIATLVAMLGGWGIALTFVGAYFLFGKYLNAWLYLGICLCTLALATVAVAVWVYKKGTKIFENL